MLSFLALLLRKKKTILIAAVAGFVLSAAVSMVLPAKYKSLAAFIPGGVERELTGSNSFLSSLGAFSETYATFIRVSRNYVIDYIVRSNRMTAMMDSRFDLRKMYGKDSFADARRELNKRTFVNVRDEGVLEIIVEASDPILARDMAAAYLEFVDSILIDLNVESAGAKVAYLEKELVRREIARAKADSAMSEFMVSRGIFEIESQAKAAFQVIGALTARVSALEVERSMLRMTRREGSDDLKQIDLEIEMLRAEIERAAVEGGDEDLFPSLSRMPGLAAEYLGMVADRRAQEFSLAFIRLKLEDAKIFAGNRTATIRVIDPPLVPEKRSWPKRKQIVIILTLASVFWTCFVILVREQIFAGRESPEDTVV
jgi:capsule polysaccharide export protein KpsE/RkpR